MDLALCECKCDSYVTRRIFSRFDVAIDASIQPRRIVADGWTLAFTRSLVKLSVITSGAMVQTGVSRGEVGIV